MEQTKRCPYCGEKILATAKKCKHCGEWLVENSNVQRPQQTITKESEFNSEYLYESDWMYKLFEVTIFGSFLQALHSSGVAQNIMALSRIPKVIGDILFGAGEICFIVLLMKVFSHLHKPLKGWFIAYIVITVILFLISLFLDNLQNESIDLLLVAGIIIFLLLPILIICHYEGKIKTLGWVMISYTIASTIIGFAANYIVSFVAFLLIFLTDLFYFFYLKVTLTKKS